MCVDLQLITNMVLLQVVIAVLLDEVQKARTQPISSLRRLEQKSSLHPLLRKLTHAFESPDDLQSRVRAIFTNVCIAASSNAKIMDESNGVSSDCAVSLQGLQVGLAELGYVPPIRFSDEEWHTMVEQQGLCDQQGLLDQQGFEKMLLNALNAFQVPPSNMSG